MSTITGNAKKTKKTASWCPLQARQTKTQSQVRQQHQTLFSSFHTSYNAIATAPNRAMAGADNNSDAALAALVLATVLPAPAPLLDGDDDVPEVL
jgi:hypothetical protein